MRASSTLTLRWMKSVISDFTDCQEDKAAKITLGLTSPEDMLSCYSSIEMYIRDVPNLDGLFPHWTVSD